MPGSKRERSPGKWTLTVTLGTDYKGKKRRFNKTFHGTAAEADKELALFYADCIRGKSNTATNLKISQIVEDYIMCRPKGSLKQNTIRLYNNALKFQIDPYIGDLQVRKTSAKHLQEWIIDLASEYSPKTIRNATFLLSASFERLIRMEELTSNPCKNLVLPKKEIKEAEYLNEEEARDFTCVLRTLNGDWLPFKIAFSLAVYCGLRSGEILGLDWQDVDLTKCTVSVRQTRYPMPGGETRIDTPKNVKSCRTVGFPFEIKNDFIALAEYYSEKKKLLGSEWIESPAVIRGTFGKPLFQGMLNQKLDELQTKHSLKRVTFHQLRHTNISIMISMGLDLKTIQERGGYSNANTPLNIYGHLFRNVDPQIAGRIYSIASRKNKTDDKRTTKAK